MANDFDIKLNDNYFDTHIIINSTDNNKMVSEGIDVDEDEYTVISIKNSISLENLLKLEKKQVIYSHSETQTDVVADADPEILPISENASSIKELELEIATLKIKNASLERNIKDISGLLNSFMKIDVSNPKIDQIRNQLTILVNRELRLHHAVPFMSFLSKYSK